MVKDSCKELLPDKYSPDMVNTVNKKQVFIASFFIGGPMPATRFIIIFQFMTRGGGIV
jgi:hypothetical protein